MLERFASIMEHIKISQVTKGTQQQEAITASAPPLLGDYIGFSKSRLLASINQSSCNSLKI